MNSLPEKVILFARFLKNRGFKVFPSLERDAMQGLEQVDISRREDFFSVLRATLARTDLEWRLFPDLFDLFWTGTKAGKKEDEEGETPKDSLPERALYEEMQVPGTQGRLRADPEEPSEKNLLEGVSYSPVSLVEKKDLGRFDSGDIPVAQLVLRNILSPFRVASMRRFRRSRRPGDMDFRRVMKKGLQSEGIPFALHFRRRKKRLKRMVVLADVSGSMDRYARFVMPFILGMKGIGSRAEVFVFSTTLTPVSPIIRRYGLEDVLAVIAREVPDWSGGTRIGHSLHQFNRYQGGRHLNKRTVAVVLSDGWDLGARNLLVREVETLSRKTHALIWLNPLAGDPEYAPLLRSMEDLLPHIDHLLPSDSLQNLKRVGRTLARVMAG